MAQDRPVLKQVSVTIDPATTSEFTFAPQYPYLLIDIEAPEVLTAYCDAVARANCTVYERMCKRYSAAEFNYDVSKLAQPESRTIKFLDTMTNAITGGTYLLTLIIIEFKNA